MHDGLGAASIDSSSLIGASVLGMVRSASLEIDPSVLKLISIDTELAGTGTDGFNQVMQELHQAGGKPKPLEREVSYRGG